ncbi:MAG: SDR family oxidoreductase [Oceanipulchritudo sp.]
MTETKTFVITGTTSGLGLALTRELLRKGHCVHGCGRREDPLGKETGQAGRNGSYTYRQLDIMDYDALCAWATEMEETGRPVDVLIHNAAVIHENANLWEIDRGALKAVVDINIMGTFNVLQAFLPQMLQAGHGMIITLSSGAGRSGIGSISGYCASKWAVEGLTKSLANELPKGMAAIPLSPGIVDTPMLRTNFGDTAANYQKADAWAKVAAPFILSLKTSRNGESLTVPES